MRIAQRFSAGDAVRVDEESVKRTTAKEIVAAFNSAVRFTDLLTVASGSPTDKSVGYYHSRASPTLSAKALTG
jgi:hypothetical protein